MDSHLNWRLAAGIGIFGTALVVVGLAVGEWDSSAWSSALISIGGAVLILAVAASVEPRLRRAVHREVAAATGQLRAEVQRLADLDVAQEEARRRRRESSATDLDRARRGPIDVTVIGELLCAAHDDGLLEEIRVRTSQRRDCHELHLLPVRASNGVKLMFCSFEPLTFDRGLVDDSLRIPVPDPSQLCCVWTSSDSASDLASELEEALERGNLDLREFSLAFALDQVVTSIETMRHARAAAEGDGSRLRGALRLLLNDRWAITTYGLESLHGPEAFEIRSAGFRGPTGAQAWWHGAVIECRQPDHEPHGPWADAIYWLEHHEQLAVLAPGEAQQHPISGLIRKSTSSL